MILIKNGYCLSSEKSGYFDLLVDGDKITRIERNIKGEFETTIDARGCLVMPAFCNAHTHLAMSLFRGLADDIELLDWLKNYIFPAEARYVNPEMVYKCSKLSMLEAIKSGTSCFVDMYFFEEEVAKAAIEIGMRGVIGEGIIDFTTPSVQSPKEAIEKTKALKREFSGSDLIRVSFAPHSTYTLSIEALKMVADSIDESDVVQIHINESIKEVELVLSQKGRRPVEILDNVGLLNDNTFLAHCVASSDEDIDRIASSGAKVINVPQSNFKLSSGIAPIWKMFAKGIDVYIGTDGPASNNNLDMVEELRFSSLSQKVKFDEKAMNAKSTLKAASNFRGLFNDLGSIEKGKIADLVVMDFSSLEATPLYDPYSFVVYAANSRDVRDVIINGRIVLRNREFVNIDEDKVKFEVKQIARRLGAL